LALLPGAGDLLATAMLETGTGTGTCMKKL